jgi:UDP-N-acetylmuramoyl-tripeptide--D-alanyl-D-alanine ligase
MVAQTKGEMLDGLGADGTAVLNHDDHFFEQWRERAGDARVVSFGASAGADYRAENIQPVLRKGRPGFAFDVHSPAGSVSVTLPLAGRHNIMNALAATAAALAAGAELSHAAAGLALARSVPGRLRAFRSNSGAMIFDDSYNANPDSVAAAIAAITEYKGEAWLVLGDMGELGDEEIEMHQAAGRLARESGVEALFCMGELGKEIGAGFGPGARWFESMEELESALREELIPGRNVLIKGSRFMGMDRLVHALEAEGGE